MTGEDKKMDEGLELKVLMLSETFRKKLLEVAVGFLVVVLMLSVSTRLRVKFLYYIHRDATSHRCYLCSGERTSIFGWRVDGL